MLDAIGRDLDEARAKIVEARQRLQAAPQDAPEIRQAVARLERIEAELDRVEAVVSAPAQGSIEAALALINANTENVDNSRQAVPKLVRDEESTRRLADFGLILPAK